MSGQNIEVGIVEMAQEAVRIFEQSIVHPYYGRLLNASSHAMDRKVQATIGRVERMIGGSFSEIAQKIERAQVRRDSFIEGRSYHHKKDSSIARDIEVQIETCQAALDDLHPKAEAMFIMQEAKEAAYKVAADDACTRFEKAQGFFNPQTVREEKKEIETLYRRAGMESWSRAERKAVKDRIMKAAIANFKAGEAMAMETMRGMGTGHHTYKSFDKAFRRIETQATGAGTWTTAKYHRVEKEMVEVAMDAVQTRLELYATAPRTFDMTPEEREREEKDIFYLYQIYGRHAKDAPSAEDFSSAIASARTESMKRAQKAKEAKDDSTIALSPTSTAMQGHVIPMFAGPRIGTGKSVPANMSGRVPDYVPHNHANKPVRTDDTDRNAQMAAGLGNRGRQLQS